MNQRKKKSENQSFLLICESETEYGVWSVSMRCPSRQCRVSSIWSYQGKIPISFCCIKSNGLLLSQPEISLCHRKKKAHPLRKMGERKSPTVFSFSREFPSLDSPGPQSFEPGSCMPGVMLWCRLGKGHCVFFNGTAGKGMCIRNLENLLSGICRGRYTGRIQLAPF